MMMVVENFHNVYWMMIIWPCENALRFRIYNFNLCQYPLLIDGMRGTELLFIGMEPT